VLQSRKKERRFGESTVDIKQSLISQSYLAPEAEQLYLIPTQKKIKP
jgi:hypothetical protein